MKKQFYQDRTAEINSLNTALTQELLTEQKLATLPRAIQRYFRLSGFVDQAIAMNADVIWRESYIKLKPNQKWKTLDTLQFNSVNPIMRTAFMKVNAMFFAGKDYYKHGAATMKGKILNWFTVIDVKGTEVSQAALITSFCEMMLLSGYALQTYVEWKEIDEYTVEAILKDADFKVQGTFYFDESGMFSHFKTDDRYFDLGNGSFEKKAFIAKVHSYKQHGSFYQPERVSISWLLDDAPFEYFKGSIERIEYNVLT